MSDDYQGKVQCGKGVTRLPNKTLTTWRLYDKIMSWRMYLCYQQDTKTARVGETLQDQLSLHVRQEKCFMITHAF